MVLHSSSNSTEGPQEDAHPPYAVVRGLRLSDRGLSLSLPVLFVQAPSGEVTLNKDALLWARESIAIYAVSKIEEDVRVLGRFMNFHRVWANEPTYDTIEPDYLMYAYLTYRHAGTRSNGGESPVTGLNWRPISSTSLRSEFRTLSRYFRFCATTWGYIDLPPHRFCLCENGQSIRRLEFLEKQKDRELFGQLSAARGYWEDRRGNESLKIPAIIKRPPKARTIRRFPTSEEITAVIRAEPNPIFKSLWLVAAFGGIRISEQLNAWQIDILPGSHRQFFFDRGIVSPDNTVLFLRTDPSESRYVDSPAVRGMTRRQFLSERYDPPRLPRSLLPKSDPLRAGWKGTQYSGDLLTHQVFWIDRGAAALFGECASEIMEFHRHNRTSKRHPWYYVNIGRLAGRHIGEPTRIRRVEAALEAAYRRVGLKSHNWGRNLQGFRHSYKWIAEHELGMSEDQIQVMLGHSRIESQDDYGKDAQTIHETLNVALVRGKSTTGGPLS